MNFTFLTSLIVSGSDAAKFLQGQLTCDVYAIKNQQSTFGAYCNQKGRVLATFQLFSYENNFYLVLPKTIAENTFNTLKKYAVFSKVTLNISNDFTLLSNDPYFKKAEWFDENSWQRFNIEKGIPTIYPKTVEMFTPHMLNLPQLGAISFTKGCYLGQEIIARTEYLGKTKRQMVQKEIINDKNLSPGEEIFNEIGEKVGTLVDSAQKDNNKYLALIVE